VNDIDKMKEKIRDYLFEHAETYCGHCGSTKCGHSGYRKLPDEISSLLVCEAIDKAEVENE